MIRQYIVTYKNHKILHNCLESIFTGLSDDERAILELFIINNHSNFVLDEQFRPYVTVLHNHLRPDFSTGHLARNWNQALINGFENLNTPACDIVIANQNDVVFKPHYIDTLLRLHTHYDLIQFGCGDACISYTPTAVKRIGLWDERFCNIGFQEFDYFLRAELYHKNKSSLGPLNGIGTKGFNHLASNDMVIEHTPTGFTRWDIDHMHSVQYHKVSKAILEAKWGHEYAIHSGKHHTSPAIKSYIMYPYFEQAIETLDIQNYEGFEKFLTPRISSPPLPASPDSL